MLTSLSMHVARFVPVLVVLLLSTMFVVTRASEAQRAASLPGVGFLTPQSSDLGGERFLRAFRQGLRELGYVEGQNIAIESRWADGKYDRLPSLAAELVRLKVNVIVAATPPAVQAVKQATNTIPIVMVGVFDPVAMGFVDSLARRGGNITGLSSYSPSWSGNGWRCSRRSSPTSRWWPSSEIRPIPTTHHWYGTRRMRPGY